MDSISEVGGTSLAKKEAFQFWMKFVDVLIKD
jgi:hypothetical protein